MAREQKVKGGGLAPGGAFETPAETKKGLVLPSADPERITKRMQLRIHATAAGVLVGGLEELQKAIAPSEVLDEAIRHAREARSHLERVETSLEVWD